MTDQRVSCVGCRESRLDFPFTMAFQPIIDLRDSRIDSHEALVRGPQGEGAGVILARPNAVYEPRACIRRTLDAAARTGFPLDRLTFELTEDERIADVGHMLSIITEYRRHGFGIALDDFGTGYSGLARLAALRPDCVKLDRALVKDCDTDRIRLAIVASMVGLASAIGVKLVAEGVERIGEVEALRGAGVRFMQGFYFARPLFEDLVPEAEIRWPVPVPS